MDLVPCYSIPLVSMCNIPSIYTKMKYLPGEKKIYPITQQIKWLLCWTPERNERVWWMPWGQNNDSLAAFSWKKKSKMENLSYFNLNSMEDCGKRDSVTSFITSTFDQCLLNSFFPSGIMEKGIFCVTGYKLLINGVGFVRMQGELFHWLMRAVGDAGCKRSSVLLQRMMA